MNNKVLVIDDDAEWCMELTEILTDEGFDVRVAMDGAEAEEMSVGNGFSVVILDLKIPKINGYGVLKFIKQNSPGLKVIILSGRPLGEAPVKEKGTTEEEVRSLSMADAVMKKPVMICELLEEVRKHARPAKK